MKTTQLGQFFFLACVAAVHGQQAMLPNNARLKDLTDATVIGTHVTLDYSAANHRLVCYREFESVQPAWYARHPYNNSWLDSATGSLSPTGVAPFYQWINETRLRGLPVHMHMLSGGPDANYYPDWFANAPIDTTAQKNTLKTKWKKMLTDVITGNPTIENGVTVTNATKVFSWDVVNEAFHYNGSGDYWGDAATKLNGLYGPEADRSGFPVGDVRRKNATHPRYIAEAFITARSKTNKDLELRETGFEFSPDPPNQLTQPVKPGQLKFRALYQLAKHLQNTPVPASSPFQRPLLNAIGFQCHLHQTQPVPQDTETLDWDKFKVAVRQFKELGLAVNITEFDEGRINGYSTKRQYQSFYETYRACREVGVESIFTWGIQDLGYEFDWNWRKGEQPLLFDANFNAKLEYYGAQQALAQTRMFSVKMRGSAGGEKVNLYLGSNLRETWFLSKEFTDYCYTGYSGTQAVRLEFVNDANHPTRGDLNVQVDFLRCNGNVYQGEQAQHTASSNLTEWMYVNESMVFPSVAGPAAPLFDGAYRITPRVDITKSVDAAGAVNVSNVRSLTYAPSGSANQEWALTYIPAKNAYKIISKASSTRGLDAAAGGTTNGTNVQLYDYDTSNNTLGQLWRLETVENGWFRITPLNALNLCLDVSGGANANVNGANIQLWTYGGGVNQQFKLEAGF